MLRNLRIAGISFSILLSLTIAFGVASGGHACSCDETVCCHPDSICTRRCTCFKRDEDAIFCQARDPLFAAYKSSFILTFTSFLALAIIGCCICCNCGKTREIVYIGCVSSLGFVVTVAFVDRRRTEHEDPNSVSVNVPAAVKDRDKTMYEREMP